MNQKYLIKPLSSLIIVFVTTTILFSKKASCIDSQFLACSYRTSCGVGPIISFPFYIQGFQKSYCGYPGFEISCKTDHPILRLSNNEYIIRQIFYENHTLHLSHASVFNNCGTIPPIQNLSLPVDKFNLSPDKFSDLFLLFKCNSTLVNRSNLLKYKVGCPSNGSSETNYSTIAIHEDDPLLKNASASCENGVEVPIQQENHSRDQWGNRTLEEIVQRGFVLNWTANDCDECRESGGRCGINETPLSFRCFCPDRPHRVSCKFSGNDKGLKIGLGVGVPAIVIILLSFYTFRRYYKRKKSDFDLAKSHSDPSSQADLEESSIYFGIPVFSYSELEEATNNFDSEKELGDGGFGTVYYGKLRDGREVAVKRLYEHNYRRLEQFMNEIKILTRLHHKNLVTLYGCTSRRSRELLLVYEYIANGTVADHLHGDRANTDPLAWPLRLSIAIETAAALAYLHASDIIHRDVKTNNILLDNNFVVKVADFGLSRLFPSDATHVSTAPQGTPGYVDPEYHQCYQLTDKSDVYSFGVVLIELISSMPAVDISRHRHEINLANLAVNKIQSCAFDELVDQHLGYRSDEEVRRSTTTVAELAFRCLQQDKELRPTMDEVLAELKRIESGENEEQQKVDSVVRQQSLPPPSPPYSDEAVLLKNARLPPSPISVAERWISSDSTTPNVSS